MYQTGTPDPSIMDPVPKRNAHTSGSKAADMLKLSDNQEAGRVAKLASALSQKRTTVDGC